MDSFSSSTDFQQCNLHDFNMCTLKRGDSILQDFEPYVIVSRVLVPAYDERLRGYFENKAVHLRHMAAIGFRFLVHSGGYVVHMPHPPSKAREWLIDPVNLETRNLIQVCVSSAADTCAIGAYACGDGQYL